MIPIDQKKEAARSKEEKIQPPKIPESALFRRPGNPTYFVHISFARTRKNVHTGMSMIAPQGAIQKCSTEPPPMKAGKRQCWELVGKKWGN
jgi:hypothetical protein